MLLNEGSGGSFPSVIKTPIRYRGTPPARLSDCCDPVTLAGDFNGDGRFALALSDSNEIVGGIANLDGVAGPTW